MARTHMPRKALGSKDPWQVSRLPDSDCRLDGDSDCRRWKPMRIAGTPAPGQGAPHRHQIKGDTQRRKAKGPP
eukprot:9226160-Pyramimonas_sp.AAC.1